MLLPILTGTKQEFEVQVYSTISAKEYLMWLDIGKDMILLMKANKMININRTEFEITTFDDEKKKYMQCCTLVSNLDRSKFNLLQFEGGSKDKKRHLATISSSITLNNSKSISMYSPKVNERNQPCIFYLLN